MEDFIEMNNILKKTGAVLMAVLLVVSSITYNPVITKAADNTKLVSLVTDSQTAQANTDMSYDFPVSDSGTVHILLYVADMVKGMMSFYNNDTCVEAVTLTDDDSTWKYDDEYGLYVKYLSLSEPVSADWKAVLNFDVETKYVFSVSQEVTPAILTPAILNQNSITLTKGFSQKLSVSGAEGNIIWTSSNNSVATVNSAGKVTAKKAGSAKIIATTEDGQELTCTVSVHKNEFNEMRMYASEVPYGNWVAQVYKMSYDKKGNLVLKTSILNNTGNRATEITTLSIKVKDASNKEIGTFKIKNKKMSLESGNASKPFKFVIKKSDLKNKKANLRTATYKPSGKVNFLILR